MSVDLNLTLSIKTALFLFALLGQQHTNAKINNQKFFAHLFSIVDYFMLWKWTGLGCRNIEVLQDLTSVCAITTDVERTISTNHTDS